MKKNKTKKLIKELEIIKNTFSQLDFNIFSC